MKKKRPWMKWLALALTVGILASIYASIDRKLLITYFARMNLGYFALALFMFVPQILVTSVRWRIMIRDIRPMGLGESIQLIMAGKALNALTPSKLGEMSKAFFLKAGKEKVDTGRAVSAVILEKVMDMGGLCVVLLLGVSINPEKTPAVWLGALIALGVLAALAFIIFVPLGIFGRKIAGLHPKLAKVADLLKGWDDVILLWRKRAGALPAILGFSVLLWSLHLLQIYLFFPALRHPVPVGTTLSLIPLAIFVGLLPITIGGMGTRDSALIFLFAPYAGAAVMAGVGLLCSMRYWLDSLLGVPFFNRYMNKISDQKMDKVE